MEVEERIYQKIDNMAFVELKTEKKKKRRRRFHFTV